MRACFQNSGIQTVSLEQEAEKRDLGRMVGFQQAGVGVGRNLEKEGRQMYVSTEEADLGLQRAEVRSRAREGWVRTSHKLRPSEPTTASLLGVGGHRTPLLSKGLDPKAWSGNADFLSVLESRVRKRSLRRA